jgi:hypothetical protein
VTTHFESTVDIDAEPAAVWAILVDLGKYGEWNTFCFQIESSLQVGTPVLLHVRMGKRMRYVQKDFVRVVEPGSRICWDMKFGWGIMHAARWQTIEPLGNGRCRYRTWERFNGFLAPIIGAVFGGDVQRGFDRMANDLKQRAESLALPSAVPPAQHASHVR